LWDLAAAKGDNDQHHEENENNGYEEIYRHPHSILDEIVSQ